MKKSLGLMFLLSVMFVVATSCVSGGEDRPKAEVKIMPDDATLVVGEDGEEIRITDGVISWWSSVNDMASWDIEIPYKGSYNVMMIYSVDGEFAGASAELRIGDQIIPWTANSTAGWSNFAAMSLGEFDLKAGTNHVELQATNIVNRFVCNVQYILLTEQ